MTKTRIFIEKRELDGNNPVGAMHDWVIKASNGDLPQEGYGHPTKADAKKAILAMYDNPTWRYNGGWIVTD